MDHDPTDFEPLNPTPRWLGAILLVLVLSIPVVVLILARRFVLAGLAVLVIAGVIVIAELGRGAE